MDKIINSITEDIESNILQELKNKNHSVLHIFYLSDDIPSMKYINNKIKKAEKFDIKSILHKPSNLSELTIKILSIPKEDKIIIQYPINIEKFGDIQTLYHQINKNQDVDGFLFDFLDIHSCITINDFMNHKSFSPTAKGVLQILNKINKIIQGSNITVIGKGLTSGLPIGNSLAKLGANITWIDKNCSEKDFIKTINNSDVIISCAGAKNIINKDTHSYKPDVIYINIGMSSDDNGNIIGDINYKEISELMNTLYVNQTLKSTGFLTTLNLIQNCI